MNKLLSLAGLVLALSAVPAAAHEEHGKARHGGIVAEAGPVEFEIVAAGDKLTVHVTEHGAALATAGASGKLTALAGGAKREIALQPAGDNLLRGQGTLAPGAKLLLSVQWPGQKPLQARAVVK